MFLTIPSISWPSFKLLIISDLSTELLSDRTDFLETTILPSSYPS